MDESLVVLIVDDDASIQSIVEDTLSDGGFEPAVASTGEDAPAKRSIAARWASMPRPERCCRCVETRRYATARSI